MTIYTIPDVAHIWQRNGGAMANVINAVAVASAESGRNSRAISPSNDWGLWQINGTNFGVLGVNEADILDPDVNAKCAIRMSGNGTNWAAWCSCWNNPGPNCGHGHLSAPQAQSPAGQDVPIVAAVLGLGIALSPGIDNAFGPSTSATSLHPVGTAWEGFNEIVGPFARDRFGKITAARNGVRQA